MRRQVPFWLAVVLFLSYWGCSKYKVASFVMPTWDTQLSAPLFNRTYTLQEIMSKDTVMTSNGDTTYIRSVGSSGVYALSKTQPINGTTVGNSLKISSLPPSDASQGESDFTITDPHPIRYRVMMNPPLPAGSTVPLISSTPSVLQPDSAFSNFRSAVLTSGTLTVTIHNGYPAALDFSNGIDITDASNRVIVNIPIPGNSLASDETFSENLSLAGYTIPNDPDVSFTYSSPGSASTSTFQSDTLVSMKFVLSDMHVSTANAIVPSQSDIVTDKSIVLSDGNKVATASIENGNLSLAMNNQFNMPVSIDLVVGSLVGQDGPLKRDFTLTAAGTPNSSYQESIPLGGYQLQMSSAGGIPTDSLRYTVTAKIPGSGGQFIDITNADSVTSTISMSSLQFDSFTGEVHLTDPIEIATDTQKVDLGDFKSKFSGTVKFSDSTALVLNINMTAGFPSLVHLKLVPRNSTMTSIVGDSVVVERMIYPNQKNYITMGEDFVSVLNSFASRTNALPDEFIISGYVIVNPGPSYSTGTVTKDDVIDGTATFTMPFNMSITNSVFTDTTKSPVVDDSSTAARLQNVDSGKVVFEINNGLPIGMSFITQLIDTTTHQVVMTLPQDSILIPAAMDFNPDGTVRSPMFSRNDFILSHDQAVALGRSYMKFIFKMRTSPDQQTVSFTKSNTISLKVYANLAFTVDKNLVGK